MATVLSAALWIAVWVAVSMLVAVLLGGVVAVRDRQVPRRDAGGFDAGGFDAVPTLPGPRREPGPFTGGADPRAPVPGR